MDKLLWIFLAAIPPAQQSDVPAYVPAPPPAETAPRLNPHKARQKLAVEQGAALRRIARSQRDVVRTFAVGWEFHSGLYLVPNQAGNWLAAEWVRPDFIDGELRDRVERSATSTESVRQHVGQKLVCRCTGVEWSFYGQKRFLVRQADLIWQ